MQTKQQILRLLSSAGLRPNKHLGQHFLIDLNIMQKLVQLADIRKDDVVLEVGCGTGALTELLAEYAGEVLAVELDTNVAKIAAEQLAEKENVQCLHTDILKSKHTISPIVIEAIRSARKTCTGRFLLVANLPYNVASAVMLNLVTDDTVADCMYVTVQKEVAQRMTASAGTKDYGSLSILLAATGEVKIERILKPSVFWPRPKIDSAMVSYVRQHEKVGRIQSMELFTKLVNLFIGHRRKMLKACTKLASGNLAEIKNWSEIFEQCSIAPTIRPEQLSPEDYINIANLLSQHLNHR